jgi:hypothetical protein
MGFKGLIRDLIMFYVGFQLLLGSTDNLFLGGLLVVVAVIFTIIGFLKMWGHV